MTEHVTSRQNPLCRHVKKLQSNRAYRYEQRQFLADGLKLVEEALTKAGRRDLIGYGPRCLIRPEGKEKKPKPGRKG